jgi:hypothetical protein
VLRSFHRLAGIASGEHPQDALSKSSKAGDTLSSDFKLRAPALHKLSK